MLETQTARLFFLPHLALCVILPHLAAESAQVTLLDQKSEPPVICISDKADPAEKFAAEELQTYLGKLTGHTLELRTIKGDEEWPAGHLIAVGKNALTRDIGTSELKAEQHVLNVTPARISIVGGSARGTLHGVYALLDQQGVRWYRPEPWGEHVPKLESLSLPEGRHISKASDYSYRSVLGGGFLRMAPKTPEQRQWGQLWAIRNRMNGADTGGLAQAGGQVSLSFGHCYYTMIPVKDYFDQHPEFFCLYQGERRRAHPDAKTLRPTNPTGLQLCLSNRAMQQIFADKIIKRARWHKSLDSVSFSVTPNDACPFCECAECAKMDDPADPKSMSNRVCTFTNIIAKKVADAVPGARVSLNAYSTWTKPPTIITRMESNVLIHIALINEWSDYTRSLDTPKPNWNSATLISLRRWQELGISGIYTYEYWSGYGWPGPLPLARTMSDRLQRYRQLNVRGVYNETKPSWGSQGLELFLFTQLINKPDLDLDTELDLYYTNYYGAAAVPMKAWHEALMNALAAHPLPVVSGGRGMHLVMTPALVQQCEGHIEEARRLVKGSTLHEKRLQGIIAAQEFATRVSRILTLKKQEGVRTPIARSTGSCLESVNAATAFEELETFLSGYFQSDPIIFDLAPKPPRWDYIRNDILHNAAFGYRHESELLKAF